MFLYDILAYMLYFIYYFSINFVFSMKFSIMTLPRYFDVSYFLTDPNENCTAYIKLEIKEITLHLFPIPFGLPIRVGSVRDTSFTYLRILFQQKKIIIIIIVITKNCENQGRSLSPFGLPIRGGGSSPLIFWDTFPPYLRMLFQQKTICCNF